MNIAVVLAGGSGLRLGNDQPKQFLKVAGKKVIEHTIEAFEDAKNRSAVLSAYYDKATSLIRDVIYQYHRKGLDEMVLGANKGRAVITSSLEQLKKVYDVAPMSVCLSIFKDSKLDELVNVYSKASISEKEKVYEILYPLYPTETTRLDKIKSPDTNK